MFPRWLSWLVLGCVLYLVFTGTRHMTDAPAPATAPQPAAHNAAPQEYPALAAATDTERWKRALNPDAAKRNDRCNARFDSDAETLALHAIDAAPGRGEGATCGDTLPVTLTVWDGRGHAAYKGEHRLVLGDRALAGGLDAGLIGLRPQGVRTLILPPAAQQRAGGATLPPKLKAVLSGKQVAIVTVARHADSDADTDAGAHVPASSPESPTAPAK